MLKIDGFINRGDDEYPFGFIDFTDGTRIGYAPGANGADIDGLFHAQQPFTVAKEGREPTDVHFALARDWAQEVNGLRATAARLKKG